MTATSEAPCTWPPQARAELFQLPWSHARAHGKWRHPWSAYAQCYPWRGVLRHPSTPSSTPFSSISTQQLKDQGRAKYCHKMSFIATVLLCTGQVAKSTLRGSLLKIPKNPASCVELYKIILLKFFFFFLKKVSYPEALRAQSSCNCDSSPSLKAFSPRAGLISFYIYITYKT